MTTEALLPEDLENSVRLAVLKGQFASEDDLVAAAVRAYLRPQQDAANGAKSDRHAELTNQEMQQRLLAAGLISEVKPPIADLDSPKESPRGTRFS